MVGQRIKELREQHGWTQFELGSASGIQPSAISRWEQGKTRPSIDSAMKIADALGITLDDLVGRKLA